MPKLTSSETPTTSKTQSAPATQELSLILLGPPGAGKGTQARALAESLGLRHLSTGELFRQHMQKETPLGVQARVYYDKGEYVPDRLVIAMVREELTLFHSGKGIVLDGFPRTVAQAEALDEILAELGQQITAAIVLVSDTEEIVTRAQGRRVCPEGHTYHTVKNPPSADGRCDIDGLPLRQRIDDRPETVRKRIDTYHNRTKPLLVFYAEKHLLKSVDGTGSIAEVTKNIESVLSEIGAR
ncbi:MAG: adenylate kinase [Chloroflexota bacterium]|nr:adenylate kinase [Chloroflexota bacterium]MDE2839077.1 adenylate kinase [Chloroflexota bacterium]MDE2929783.1 adenylate kinase [Chloroflexota bacterium]